jgi:prepilin-type N-terminal cleavage/methylation domain-containing protein
LNFPSFQPTAPESVKEIEPVTNEVPLRLMHGFNSVTTVPGKTHLRPSRGSGFSLIETMIVLAVMMIASGMFFMSLQPALKDTRVTNAYIHDLDDHAPGAGSGDRRTPHLCGDV